MKLNKWELVEDEYYRKQRLVSYPSGLLVGGTYGSNHSNDGWCAWIDGRSGRENIGNYVTEDLAKKAVEDNQPKDGAK